jgi:hypothetical protein
MLASSDVEIGKEQNGALTVQGMSDLAAPLLCVMRDEAEAFWCFACLMEKLEVLLPFYPPSPFFLHSALSFDMGLFFQDGGLLPIQACGRSLGMLVTCLVMSAEQCVWSGAGQLPYRLQRHAGTAGGPEQPHCHS